VIPEATYRRQVLESQATFLGGLVPFHDDRDWDSCRGAVAAVGDLNPLVLVGRFAEIDVSVRRGVTDAGHVHTWGAVDRRYLPTRPYRSKCLVERLAEGEVVDYRPVGAWRLRAIGSNCHLDSEGLSSGRSESSSFGTAHRAHLHVFPDSQAFPVHPAPNLPRLVGWQRLLGARRLGA
jgi:hypothetical protein